MSMRSVYGHKQSVALNCRLENVSNSFYDMGCVTLTLLFLYCRDNSQ